MVTPATPPLEHVTIVPAHPPVALSYFHSLALDGKGDRIIHLTKPGEVPERVMVLFTLSQEDRDRWPHLLSEAASCWILYERG